MLVKNCPTCHTDITVTDREGNTRTVTIDLDVFSTFKCQCCGEEFMARPDLRFQKVGGGLATHNDPRTDEGKAEARKIREARALASK